MSDSVAPDIEANSDGSTSNDFELVSADESSPAVVSKAVEKQETIAPGVHLPTTLVTHLAQKLASAFLHLFFLMLYEAVSVF